ncbi:MAG: hypothetical protein WA979_01735 [Pacificimonas sp.]
MSSFATSPPRVFWILSTLLLLWQLVGCAMYLGSVMLDSGALAEREQAIAALTPGWVTAAFAIAVWTGLGAAILLLLRRRLAIPAYFISLIAIIVQNIAWLIADIRALMLPVEMGVSIVVVLTGLFALWYSRRAAAKGWLR